MDRATFLLFLVRPSPLQAPMLFTWLVTQRGAFPVIRCKWAKELEVPGGVLSSSSVKVAGSSIFISGQFYDGSFNGKESSGRKDLFLVKYDSNGSVVWTATKSGKNGDLYSNGLTINTRGDLFALGSLNGKLDDNLWLGGLNCFIVKFSPMGEQR